jgi:hypothetical protein
MKTWLSASAIVIAGAMLWSGTALGQTSTKPGCDAMKAGAPQKVEGQVVSVDAKSGKVMIKAGDGKTHEFTASQETVRDFKVGDKIEAQLRGAANC